MICLQFHAPFNSGLIQPLRTSPHASAETPSDNHAKKQEGDEDPLVEGVNQGTACLQGIQKAGCAC